MDYTQEVREEFQREYVIKQINKARVGTSLYGWRDVFFVWNL